MSATRDPARETACYQHHIWYLKHAHTMVVYVHQRLQSRLRTVRCSHFIENETILSLEGTARCSPAVYGVFSLLCLSTTTTGFVEAPELDNGQTLSLIVQAETVVWVCGCSD